MPNINEKAWYKNPAIIGAMAVIVAAIIGGIFGLIPYITEKTPTSAELEIIKVDFSEVNYDYAVLDFIVKNDGDKTAVIHTVTAEVLKYETKSPHQIPFLRIPPSENVSIELKPREFFSNESSLHLGVEPDKPDRFIMKITSETSACYDINIAIHYDSKTTKKIIKNISIRNFGNHVTKGVLV